MLIPAFEDPLASKFLYYCGLVLWGLVLLFAATLEIWLRGNYFEKSFNQAWKSSWEHKNKKPLTNYKETLERRCKEIGKAENLLGLAILVVSLVSMSFYSREIHSSPDLVWVSTFALVSLLIPGFLACLVTRRFLRAVLDRIDKLTIVGS